MTEQSGFHIGKDEFTAVDIHKKTPRQISTGSIFDRINDWIILKSKVKAKIKVTFFRLLATMINAGVSLVKSLHILEEQTENLKMKKICTYLAKSVEMGQSLSSAMDNYPDVFQGSQIGMIKSGEVSGKLNDVLLQIADQTEKHAKIAGKIKGAMMYPIAIIFVLICVTIAVLILVIPNLTEMFTSAGADLPMATQMLVNMSAFLTGSFLGMPNWMNMAIGVGLFFMLLGYWKKTDNGRYYWDKFILMLPVFGMLNRKVVLAKFCGSLATLTKSGISIVKAIKITGEVVGNEVYKKRILMIAEDVQQGITIAENIQGDKKMFPAMLVSMIGVGEQTAQVDAVCEKVADFYDEEVDNMVKNLSALMEPLIILMIGVVVGFLVAAIMSPIMKMSEVASQA